MRKSTSSILVVLIVVIIALLVWWKIDATGEKNEKLAQLTGGTPVTITASATCGCCKLYANYLEKEGFTVNFNALTDQDEIERIKNENRIPSTLRSCHTSKIGNYIIEGHIPVEAIVKLLEEKPAIRGIALPGMPSASPGMPGPKYGPFTIKTITNEGQDGGIFMEI